MQLKLHKISGKIKENWNFHVFLILHKKTHVFPFWQTNLPGLSLQRANLYENISVDESLLKLSDDRCWLKQYACIEQFMLKGHVNNNVRMSFSRT